MEPLLGMISLCAINFAPRGWAPCDGAVLPISQNQALFAILGNRYGGDGRATFALPKLESPDSISQYLIAIQGVFPSRP